MNITFYVLNLNFRKFFLSFLIYTFLAFPFFHAERLHGQELDPSYKPLLSQAANITLMQKQPDGKILVFGDQSVYHGKPVKNLFRLNQDLTLDTTFVSLKFAPYSINKILLLEDSSILLGGSMGYYNDQHLDLMKLNHDGTIDPNFAGSNDVNSILDMAVQADGKLVISSWNYEYNGTRTYLMFRLNKDGSLDQEFNQFISELEISNPPDKIVLQEDQKILFNNDKILKRLNPDGSVDQSFAAITFEKRISEIELQQDGKILAGCDFLSTFNLSSTSWIVRFNSDGTLDPNFNLTHSDLFPTGEIKQYLPLNDGKILVIGESRASNNRGAYVFRLNADGTTDETFARSTSGVIYEQFKSLLLMDNGQYLAGGNFKNYLDQPGPMLLVNSDGSLAEKDLQVHQAANIYGAAIDSQKKLLISGNFSHCNLQPVNNTIRLNSDGTIDPSFSLNSKWNSTSVKILPLESGNYLFAGNYTGNTSSNPLQMVDLNGNIAGTFQLAPTLINTFNEYEWVDIIPAADKFYFVTEKNIYRLQQDGSLDATFSLKFELPFDITAFGLLPDGNLIAGGVKGLPSFIRFSPDGVRDDSFGTELANEMLNYKEFIPSSFRNFQDGRILVLGKFNTYGTGDPDYLMVLDEKGNLDTNWKNNSRSIGKVEDALILDQNQVIYGGESIHDQFDLRFKMKDGNDMDVPALRVIYSIKNILPVDKNTLLLAGNFKSLNDQHYYSLARLIINPQAIPVPELQPLKLLENDTVLISWKVEDQDKYKMEVQRRTGAGSFVTIAVVDPGKSSFKDSEAEPGKICQYRINQVHPFTTVTFSAIEEIKVPISSHVSPEWRYQDFDKERLWLAWKTNAVGYQKFHLQQARDTLKPAEYQSSFPALSETQITYPGYGSTWFFRIRSVHEDGFSSWSKWLKVSIPAPEIYPPYQVQARAEGNQYVQLSWQDSSKVIEGFKIYRFNGYQQISNTLYSSRMDQIAVLSGDSRSFADQWVNSGREYVYYVESFGGGYTKSSALIQVELEDLNSGNWEAIGSITPRSDAVAFSIGAYGYVGLGFNGSTRLKDFQKYDPQNNIWEPVADFPGTARSSAVAFVIDGMAYVGGGQLGGNTSAKDFYVYDPATNSWAAIADYPDDHAGNEGISDGAAFSLQGLGYVCLGVRGMVVNKEVWAYDPQKNEWLSKFPFIGSQSSGAAVWTDENYGYLAFGGVLNVVQEAYRYNPANNTWAKLNNTTYFRKDGVGFNYFNSGLVLTGDNSSSMFSPSYTLKSSVYLKDRDGWHNLAGLDFSGPGRTSACGFQIGNHLYLGTGYNNNYLGDFYRFTPAILPPPPSVTDLKQEMTSSTSNKISWNYPAETAESLVAELSTGAGSYLPEASLPVHSRSYTLENLVPGEKYSFRIKALNSSGSSEYQEVTFYAALKPAKPDQIAANAEGPDQVKLTWADQWSDEQEMEIWFRKKGAPNFYQTGSSAKDQIQFIHSGLDPETDYEYKLRVINLGGYSEFSDTLSVRTGEGIPIAPEGFAGKATRFDQVDLTWLAPLKFTRSILLQVYTRTDSLPLKEFNLDINNRGYQVYGLKVLKAYYFKLSFRNYDQVSTTEFLPVTTLDYPMPVEPEVRITTNVFREVKLSWKYPGISTMTVEIWRSLNSTEGFTMIHQTDNLVADTVFTDRNLNPSTVYYYQVVNRYQTNKATSENLEITTYPTLPLAPENLALTRKSKDEILLSWTDMATNEEGFIIWLNEGNLNKTDTIPANHQQYIYHLKTSLEAGFKFTLNAFNLSGISDTVESAPLFIYQEVPEAPLRVELANEQNQFLNLVWDAPVNSVAEGYLVEHFQDGEFVLLDSVSETSYQFLLNGDYESGKEERFRVIAYNQIGNSAFSEEIYLVVLSLQDQMKQSIRFFPNPVRDILKVETPVPVRSLRILNTEGKSVLFYSRRFTGEGELNLSHLPAGLYLVILETDTSQVEFKIRKD